MILNNAKNVMIGNKSVSRLFCNSKKIWERPGINPDDWSYSIENNEVRILGYKGSDTDIWMPSVIENCPVRYVGSGEKRDRISGIENVISLRIADSVKRIEDYAIYSVYDNDLKLKKIWFGDGAESIGAYVASYCHRLEYVKMGKNLKTIGDYAFYYSCNSLDDYTAQIIIGENVETIGRSAFEFCAYVKSFEIPETVTTINPYAFCSCRAITSITIPDSVQTIGKKAFYDCTSLRNVSLNNTLSYIPQEMFSHCYKLQTVTVPKTVTNIEDYAFSYCYELKNVYVPSSCSYAANAFEYSNYVNVIRY